MAKTLGVKYMTFKDVHIPRTDPPETTRRNRRKIEAAGITIMGGGTITLTNDPEEIRKDFAYAKVAGFPLILRVARTGGARHDRADGEGVRHQGRHPQPRPGGQVVAAPAGRLRGRQVARQPHGPVHRHRPHERDRAPIRAAILRMQGPRVRHARQGSGRSERPTETARLRSGAACSTFPRLFRTLLRDRLPGPGRARVPDPRRRPAARA